MIKITHPSNKCFLTPGECEKSSRGQRGVHVVACKFFSSFYHNELLVVGLALFDSVWSLKMTYITYLLKHTKQHRFSRVRVMYEKTKYKNTKNCFDCVFVRRRGRVLHSESVAFLLKMSGFTQAWWPPHGLALCWAVRTRLRPGPEHSQKHTRYRINTPNKTLHFTDCKSSCICGVNLIESPDMFRAVGCITESVFYWLTMVMSALTLDNVNIVQTHYNTWPSSTGCSFDFYNTYIKDAGYWNFCTPEQSHCNQLI